MEQRKVDSVSGEKLREVVKRAFPLNIDGHIDGAICCNTGEVVEADAVIRPGGIFQVWLSFKQFSIAPFGLLRLDPLMSVKALRSLLSQRFFGGHTEVFLRASAVAVPDTQTLA